MAKTIALEPRGAVACACRVSWGYFNEHGRASESVDLVVQAIARDDDLAALRGHPRWEALVK